MRIVQIIPDFGLGGIQKAGCVLADEFARLGYASIVLGKAAGPRFGSCGSGASHQVYRDSDDLGARLRTLGADVVHIHSDAFEPVILDVAKRSAPKALLVSTPVFGRPPADRKLLEDSRTCCVGVYAFYRFCRWMGCGPVAALRNGVGFVPLTPYQAPDPDPGDSEGCRQRLGVPFGARVVGRVGRETVSKWSFETEHLVEQLLLSDDRTSWLSVGFPAILGRDRLRQRWKHRFLNLAETSDTGTLASVYRALDVQLLFGHGECFSSTICEAAGLGVPTIALATPLRDNGQAEQIVDGETGFLVSGVDDAKRRVRDLFAEPEQLSRMKMLCTARARERWGVPRVARDLLSLYATWRGSLPAAECAYLDVMRIEATQFAETYHTRMRSLFGGRTLSPRRAAFTVSLHAAEFWPAFLLGRSLKRWRERILRFARRLPEDSTDAGGRALPPRMP